MLSVHFFAQLVTGRLSPGVKLVTIDWKTVEKPTLEPFNASLKSHERLGLAARSQDTSSV